MPGCIVAPTGVVGSSQAHPHEGADGSTQNTPGEASDKDPWSTDCFSRVSRGFTVTNQNNREHNNGIYIMEYMIYGVYYIYTYISTNR